MSSHLNALTPPASGTVTPTATVSNLTDTHIKSQEANTNAPAGTSPTTPSPLKASNLKTTLTTSPQPVPAFDDPIVANSSTCTDHMMTVSWTLDRGWHTPEIRPYGPLSLMPTASVLHYATECFEGMKLYRGHDGKLRFFRPSRNCARMRRSAQRIALPDFEPSELEKLILALAKLDGPKWLPESTHKGRFLYCRPTLISDDASLGVQKPKQALLFVILTVFPDMSRPDALGPSPSSGVGGSGTGPSVADQQAEAVQGLTLLASREDTIRAWPGGFGFAKLGANYGPSLLAQGEARARGFNQILWLFGEDAYVTEAGASNFFIVMKDKNSGKTQLITAGLEDKVILEGVTRDSILRLAKERLPDEVEVMERKFTMAEVDEAITEGRVVEAFAAGTAFFVAPVGLIEWRGKSLKIPTSEGSSGKYAKMLRTWLENIMYGRESHEWGVVVDED